MKTVGGCMCQINPNMVEILVAIVAVMVVVVLERACVVQRVMCEK